MYYTARIWRFSHTPGLSDRQTESFNGRGRSTSACNWANSCDFVRLTLHTIGVNYLISRGKSTQGRERCAEDNCGHRAWTEHCSTQKGPWADGVAVCPLFKDDNDDGEEKEAIGRGQPAVTLRLFQCQVREMSFEMITNDNNNNRRLRERSETVWDNTQLLRVYVYTQENWLARFIESVRVFWLWFLIEIAVRTWSI